MGLWKLKGWVNTLSSALTLFAFLLVVDKILFLTSLSSPKPDPERVVTSISKIVRKHIPSEREQVYRKAFTRQTTEASSKKFDNKTVSVKSSEKFDNKTASVMSKHILSPSGTTVCSITNIYSVPSAISEEALSWCNRAVKEYGVSIGRSWGSLPRNMQLQWDKLSCNELLKTGKLQSCDQRWGWKSFSEWIGAKVKTVSGSSDVTCIINLRTSTFCRFMNVSLDFSKVATPGGTHRSFETGFFNLYGTLHSNPMASFIPGLNHISRKLRYEECDVIETKPAFILSNDDIYNLGHYYNDVMSIWSASVLANRDTKDSVIINFDGFRDRGPAGGMFHRLMEKSNPDVHGPYVGYYKSWFDEVKKASEYGRKKVCFSELYLMPYPGTAWFWNDWGRVSECSTVAASPLYQSYNLFMRKRWLKAYGVTSLKDPDIDNVHIVIEVRAINKKKLNNHSSARHIANLQALIEALSLIPRVRVTAQDFAVLPFAEQVSLSHSAGVFISMHGAGTTHIFHSALGQPNCCALVELQPDHTIGFQDAQGYGNIARMLGLHYFRYEASMGRTTDVGTQVEVDMVRSLVEHAVAAVRDTPTCLHSIKDTTRPIYSQDF